MDGSRDWPDDARAWLGELPPPGAEPGAIDPLTSARIVGAVRAAYAAGLVAGKAEGRREVLATVRRRLREEVVPALTVVLISLELTDNRNRLQAPAVLRLRGAVLRLRGAVLHLRTAAARPPGPLPDGAGPAGPVRSSPVRARRPSG